MTWLVVPIMVAAGLVGLPFTQAAVADVVQLAPVATGLDDPTAFTFAPDGRIYYGERKTGEIRLLDPGVGDTLAFRVPKVSATNTGLVGLELHPDFPGSPFVYAYATRTINGVDRDQLLRISLTSTPTLKVLLNLRAGPPGTHHGGRVLFGPDGALYLVIGDEGRPGASQNLDVKPGKILRLTASGGVPADNPVAGSPVFASGIRNSIGFAFDPQTGYLWMTDNGPECNDEVNRIIASGNYGWGRSATCATPPPAPVNTNQDGPSPILPAHWEPTPTAPTGLGFCDGCGLGAAFEGAIVHGEFVTGRVQAATLDGTRTAITSVTTLATNARGMLSVEPAPDGRLYVSDREGIYRLTPAA